MYFSKTNLKVAFIVPILSLFISFFVNQEARASKVYKAKRSSLKLRLAGVVRVGRQPKQIGVTPDNKKAYSTNFGGKSISVIDLKSFKVKRVIASGGAPVELSFTPNGKYIYITDFGGALWKIDTQKDKIVARIKGHRYPKGVAVHPNGKEVFFASWWWPRGYVTVVRVSDNKILRRYRVWDRPRGLVFSPDGKWFFQCHFGGPGVKEGMGMAFLRSKDGHLKRFVKTGKNARHAVVSRDGKYVYASNTGSNYIVQLSAKTARILRKIKVGRWPKTIDLTSDGAFLFVANYAGRSLSVVDTKKGKEILRIPMGDRISGLDVSPDDRYVYITGWDTQKVWRFEIIR